MASKTLPRVIAAERRAVNFALPEHESEAARATSFKRAIELCEWAMREFVRAGRDDAARATWKAIDVAEGASPNVKGLLEEIKAAIGGTTGAA
jgi:hypothetical protein